jgi:hypothetical protein
VLNAVNGSEKVEFQAGEPAPDSGEYIELNVFGTQSAPARWFARGQPFPAQPVGYSWKRATTPCVSVTPAEHRETPAQRSETV